MAPHYELHCTDCPFRAAVEGELSAVHDEIEAHREERGAGPTEHFVNVRCTRSSPRSTAE